MEILSGYGFNFVIFSLLELSASAVFSSSFNRKITVSHPTAPSKKKDH